MVNNVHENDYIIDNFICWMTYRKTDAGQLFFCTRDLAIAMNISVGEIQKYLNELYRCGAIGQLQNNPGTPYYGFCAEIHLGKIFPPISGGFSLHCIDFSRQNIYLVRNIGTVRCEWRMQ
ncbi:hypothetical protein EWJ82_19965 [Salmonella enterica subsp. enterica serovar Weybridge]|nr:hypothetical protein [Salmonella enterica subsp. enterica serovar Weybridge]